MIEIPRIARDGRIVDTETLLTPRGLFYFQVPNDSECLEFVKKNPGDFPPAKEVLGMMNEVMRREHEMLTEMVTETCVAGAELVNKWRVRNMVDRILSGPDRTPFYALSLQSRGASTQTPLVCFPLVSMPLVVRMKGMPYLMYKEIFEQCHAQIIGAMEPIVCVEPEHAYYVSEEEWGKMARTLEEDSSVEDVNRQDRGNNPGVRDEGQGSGQEGTQAPPVG